MKKEGPSGRNPDGPSLGKSVNFGWMSVNFREVGVNFRRASVNFVGKWCEECSLNPIAAHSPGSDNTWFGCDNTRPSSGNTHVSSDYTRTRSDYTRPSSDHTQPRSANTHLIPSSKKPCSSSGTRLTQPAQTPSGSSFSTDSSTTDSPATNLPRFRLSAYSSQYCCIFFRPSSTSGWNWMWAFRRVLPM